MKLTSSWSLLSLYYLGVATAFSPTSFIPHLASRSSQTSEIEGRRINTHLWVSIGIGPPKDQNDDERMVSINEAAKAGTKGFDDQEVTELLPTDPTLRKSRMSRTDEKCDEWFTSLLEAGSGSTLPESITGIVRETLMHQVEAVDVDDPTVLKNLELGDEGWSPFTVRRLPGKPFLPPFGMEQYGIPILRRSAEPWRQFDVPGLVEKDYSGAAIAIGTDLNLNDSTAEQYRNIIMRDGSWLSDDDCHARLVYINGQYCPTLSKSPEGDATITNVNGGDADSELLNQPHIQKALQRLPDGFTDELPSSLDDEDAKVKSICSMSGPDHCVGPARSQFAMNNQQGTAAFAALNTLKCGAVTLVDLPKDNVECEKPILVIQAYTSNVEGEKQDTDQGVSFHPRLLVTAAAGSKASVVQSMVDIDLGEEDQEKATPKLHNGYTQFFVGSNANITHSYIDESGGIVTSGVEKNDDPSASKSPRQIESQRKGLADTHLEMIDVYVTGKKGHYSGTMMGVGGCGRSRIAMCASLLQKEAQADINGLSLSGGAQRSDMRTTTHHVEQGTISRQQQKNMVGGRATCTFKGRIRVEQDAQQTDADQLARSLLLTDKSRIWAIPSLEIIADDVKCTHGATVSDLSDEELFYLRSRGLDRSMARNLLMYAFVDEIGQEIDPDILGNEKKGLKQRVVARLQNLVPTGERAVLGEFQSS